MNFYEKCRQKGWGTSRNGVPMSNILMDGSMGGKLFVPSDSYDTEFMPIYRDAIKDGEKLYLIECRTEPLFKWHADIDLLFDSEVTELEIGEIIKTIGSAISISENLKIPKPLVVLRTTPKNHKNLIKTGIHIICPTLEVDAERAVVIQQKSVELLNKAKLNCKNEGGWEDAFDTSVYNGSGLRMTGSRKMDICECRKKQNESVNCKICNGKGKLDGGRPYELFGVWSTTGDIMNSWKDALKTNFLLLCQKSSIKCLHSGGTLQQTKGKVARKVIMSKHQNKASSILFDKGVRLAELCNDCPHEYKNLGVMSVAKVEDISFLSVIGDSQHYCGNVGRNHSNSNIYFMVRGSHIYQRCYCKKYECNWKKITLCLLVLKILLMQLKN